jgi:hypothetical protein
MATFMQAILYVPPSMRVGSYHVQHIHAIYAWMSEIRNLGTPIKQQRALMIHLGIAHEEEVIGDETLEAYLALFGWQPDALPLAGMGDEDMVV